MKAVIIAIVALLVIAGGVFALTNKSDKKVETKQDTTQSTPAETNNNPNDQQNTNVNEQNGTTITYSNDGFSPTTLTVKAGSTITVKNTSSRTLQFASDPHPAHTDNSELNVGSISTGESKSFTINKTGNFSFHNHLNPSEKGTIAVE